MKIKERFLNAFAAKNFDIPNLRTDTYRSTINDFNDVYQLETEDFDKAIRIMQMNNKKAGMKEFSLLKEEFLTAAAEGKYPEANDYQPNNFLDRVEEVATKRLSDVEKRKVRQQIVEYWSHKDLYNSASNICKMINAWDVNLNEIDEAIKTLQKVKELKVEKQKDLIAWLKQQVDENEATLDKLDSADWEEFNHFTEVMDEQIKELGSVYYRS